MLPNIYLQHLTQALPGTIETMWFENAFVGLQPTFFHSVKIPLAPFNSGLTYEQQPVETDICIEWIQLNLDHPTDLDGLHISMHTHPKMESSVYIGGAHNVCDVEQLSFQHLEGDLYRVEGALRVDFAAEGVAQNTDFVFSILATFVHVDKAESHE